MASRKQQPSYLTTEERRARGRIAIATRWHQQPAPEDLALLEAAKADQTARRLRARLSREDRARLAWRLLDPDDDGQDSGLTPTGTDGGDAHVAAT